MENRKYDPKKRWSCCSNPDFNNPENPYSPNAELALHLAVVK